MRLIPSELDRSAIFIVTEPALRRLVKEWRLNDPEALGFIAGKLREAALRCVLRF
jgi:urease gamma subunit